MDMQQTIERPAMCAGVGVHSGEKARLVLKPAPVGTGVVFRRTDLGLKNASVLAHANNVSDVQLGTTISNEAGVSVAVVEHLMAAVCGLGIDNLLIEIDGPEVPIMDGSSAVYCELLLQAGLKQQTAPRRRIRILETIEIVDGPKRASLSPSPDNHLTLRARIEYDNSVIGIQQMALRLAPGMFARDLAFARTAASDVLTRGGKDISQPWENPSTGARGSVTPIASAYTTDGRTCRDFLASYVNGSSESWLQGAACRSAGGQWEIHTLKPWKEG